MLFVWPVGAAPVAPVCGRSRRRAVAGSAGGIIGGARGAALYGAVRALVIEARSLNRVVAFSSFECSHP